MNEQELALDIIEALGSGQPPRRGFQRYSVGYEDLIAGIKKEHLANIGRRGVFRFLSGSPGRGKTHLFRLIREVALEDGCLVSNVELNALDTPFYQLDRVFSAVIRKIYTPSLYQEDEECENGFERLLKEALNYLSIGKKGNDKVTTITSKQLLDVQGELQRRRNIILDFKMVVQTYWGTFVQQTAVHPNEILKKQDELLQWFEGGGDKKDFKKYEINSMLTGQNAQAMLKSLSGFVRLAGYSGLVILFDEGARACRLMTSSDRKKAHENLFGLISNIQSLDGLYFIYATTPDLFTDPDYGIMCDLSMAGRLSLPRDAPPKANHTTWNLDAQPAELDQYKEAARKIRNLYAEAHPDPKTELPSEDQIDTCVETLQHDHASREGVGLWRAMVRILVSHLDGYDEGNPRSIEEVRDEVMADIREGV